MFSEEGGGRQAGWEVQTGEVAVGVDGHRAVSNLFAVEVVAADGTVTVVIVDGGTRDMAFPGGVEGVGGAGVVALVDFRVGFGVTGGEDDAGGEERAWRRSRWMYRMRRSRWVLGWA